MFLKECFFKNIFTQCPFFLFSVETENKAHPLENIQCGIPATMPDLKIVGGRRAIKDSWPWQVSNAELKVYKNV